MTMIFVLAVLGCGVFTTYASGLFFRHKSRDVGILLALGASKDQLRRVLTGELALMSLSACALGALLGTPLAWFIWQGFRLLLVDSEEMALAFDPHAYLLALAFSLFVVVMLFVMLGRFLRRTNILDVVNESRKSEPIRAVPGGTVLWASSCWRRAAFWAIWPPNFYFGPSLVRPPMP